MSHTLDYYNHNAASYVENTRQADIHLLQEKFLALLNEGNTILDFQTGRYTSTAGKVSCIAE